MAMSYSYDLQAKVFDKMTALESKLLEPKPKSKTEILMLSLQSIMDIEQEQQAIKQNVIQLGARIEQVAESQVWDHCPQNSEPITRIRERMNKKYGLPGWVVDTVMRGLPLSPKIHGMVRHQHIEAQGAHYEVWAVADVTRVFSRFIGECKHETTMFVTHLDIEGRFKLTDPIAHASNDSTLRGAA